MIRETRIKSGRLRGMPAADPRVSVFRGIPYAQPPVNELRFRAPVPVQPWDGVLDCREFGTIPMQDIPGGDPEEFYAKEWHVDPKISMGEDCLNLNVWTPAKTLEEKLPVFVWIFGGGFQCGYSSEMEFDGERLARRGIVVVSMNYRVNIFGLLAHEELSAETPHGPNANFGMLDQMAAMQWVRENIAAFGGDADNITIGGQSAGAGSVLNHIASPMTEGLFHKAIMQSGGGLRTKVFVPLKNKMDAEQLGKEFFEFAGIRSLEEARALSAGELFEAYVKFRDIHGYVCFQPCVDGHFLVEDPSQAIINGHHKNIPYLLGHTSGEQFGIPATLQDFSDLIRRQYPDCCDEILNVTKDFTTEQMQDLFRGDVFNVRQLANILFCRVQVMQNRHSPFLYYFAPDSIPGDNAGAFHSSDLWFTFETLAKCSRPFHGKHYDLARKMCNYWTNFVKSGNPNGDDTDGEPMPEWVPFSNASPNCLQLNENEISMQTAESALAKIMYCKHLQIKEGE